MKTPITLLLAIVLALALSALPAQTVVNVGNYSGNDFYGWVRATVDKPIKESGRVEDVLFVAGPSVGLDARIVDLKISLRAGELRSVDLSNPSPAAFVRGSLPQNPLAYFGGVFIASQPMMLISLNPSGAGYDTHFRARSSAVPMLCTDLWLTWYPDCPGWATGEAMTTASNPSVPDVTATIPSNFNLIFGEADVYPLGAPSTGLGLLTSGTQLADGQAISLPITLVWRKNLGDIATDWASAGAVSTKSIVANGISRLWPTGNPSFEGSALTWTRANWQPAINRLRTWEAGPLGVAARSGDTGKQEDQIYPGGECTKGPESLGAETVRYFVALGQSRRPRNHLEPNGELLSLTAHPHLVMWDSRAHWHAAVSPDQLGKSRQLTLTDTHGWWGADEEHWLMRTLALAYRLTGSPALQHQLESEARVFLYQKTINPKNSTTRPGAARAVGWEGLAAVDLWYSLNDRKLAHQVAQRWRDRFRLVHNPVLSQKVADIWQTTDDVRWQQETGTSGTQQNWSPYQQALGAYGMDIAGEFLGPPEARQLALRAARCVMERAFTPDGRGWATIAFRGTDIVPLVQSSGAHYGPSVWVWHTAGIATILRNEPSNQPALRLYNLLATNQRWTGSWIPPELLSVQK